MDSSQKFGRFSLHRNPFASCVVNDWMATVAWRCPMVFTITATGMAEAHGKLTGSAGGLPEFFGPSTKALAKRVERIPTKGAMGNACPRASLLPSRSRRWNANRNGLEPSLREHRKNQKRHLVLLLGWQRELTADTQPPDPRHAPSATTVSGHVGLGRRPHTRYALQNRPPA